MKISLKNVVIAIISIIVFILGYIFYSSLWYITSPSPFDLDKSGKIFLGILIICLTVIPQIIFYKKEIKEEIKSSIKVNGKKQENKRGLYANIFVIIVFFFIYLIWGLGIGVIPYLIIVFGELLVFSKFKNENVTWSQITGFIVLSLIAGLFIVVIIAASAY